MKDEKLLNKLMIYKGYTEPIKQRLTYVSQYGKLCWEKSEQAK
jgi:hypothetical protein